MCGCCLFTAQSKPSGTSFAQKALVTQSQIPAMPQTDTVYSHPQACGRTTHILMHEPESSVTAS